MKVSAALLCICAFASAAHAQGPPGLRGAIAKHRELREEASRRLNGARIPAADPASYEFSFALVNLDADNIRDAIVLFTGQEDCGSGGRSLEIYRGTKQGFDFLSESTISREPIRILPDSRFGWRSFTEFVSGGGAKPCDALMQFDGREYSSNPSTAPCATPAQLASSKPFILTK
jgi:hypothetical protein